MALRPFFRRHIRLAQFICPHEAATDIGPLITCLGKACMVRQCDDCGLIFVGTELFREPNGIGMMERAKIFDDDD